MGGCGIVAIKNDTDSIIYNILPTRKSGFFFKNTITVKVENFSFQRCASSYAFFFSHRLQVASHCHHERLSVTHNALPYASHDG